MEELRSLAKSRDLFSSSFQMVLTLDDGESERTTSVVRTLWCLLPPKKRDK